MIWINKFDTIQLARGNMHSAYLLIVKDDNVDLVPSQIRNTMVNKTIRWQENSPGLATAVCWSIQGSASTNNYTVLSIQVERATPAAILYASFHIGHLAGGAINLITA